MSYVHHSNQLTLLNYTRSYQICETLRWSKYFYMTSVPSHNSLDWKRLEPTADDFTAAMTSGGRVLLEEDTKRGKVFTVPKSFTLPKCLNFTVKGLSKNERSAGTAANQRAAAATMWILSNAGSNFVHSTMTWTGTMAFWFPYLLFFDS